MGKWRSIDPYLTDLNAEFDNLLNNALSLVSPWTANMSAGGFRLTNLSVGTVSDPSLYFTGDTGTGLFRPAASTPALTGNSLRLFQARPAAAAVNYFDLVASATTTPLLLQSEGTDTNVGLDLSSKGTGAVRLMSGQQGRTIARFNNVASSVNFFDLSPAATGTPGRLLLDATGTDTYTSIDIRARSNSVMGTILRLEPNNTTIANFLNMTPSAAGDGPSFAAVGSDANVRLYLDSKGTGQLRLNSLSTGDILWGMPLVALGGGVAPTLGTIGGSGPATAAQNTWLRFLDSTGAAAWLPVWK